MDVYGAGRIPLCAHLRETESRSRSITGEALCRTATMALFFQTCGNYQTITEARLIYAATYTHICTHTHTPRRTEGIIDLYNNRVLF